MVEDVFKLVSFRGNNVRNLGYSRKDLAISVRIFSRSHDESFENMYYENILKSENEFSVMQYYATIPCALYRK